MTESNVVATVILLKLVELALLLILTHKTYNAVQGTQYSEIRALNIGFASMAFGILAGGGTFLLFQFDLIIGLFIESGFSAFGLGLIVYSLLGYD